MGESLNRSVAMVFMVAALAVFTATACGHSSSFRPAPSTGSCSDCPIFKSYPGNEPCSCLVEDVSSEGERLEACFVPSGTCRGIAPRIAESGSGWTGYCAYSKGVAYAYEWNYTVRIYFNCMALGGTWTGATPDHTDNRVSGRVTGADRTSAVRIGVAGSSLSSFALAVDGEYALQRLPAGTYTLTPSSARYTFTPQRQTITVVSGGSLSLPDFAAAHIR